MLPNLARRTEIARRLTQPLVLEDGRPPRVLVATLITISGFVIATVVWASVTRVREVTIAQGQIVPRGQVQTVQHLEGGIVAEIFVKEGSRVAAQQPLIRLRPESSVGERNQYEARRVALKLQLIRLEAQSRGEAPDFDELAKKFPDLATEQEKLYVSAIIQRRQEQATLAAKVAQKRGEIATLTYGLESASAQVDVQRELVEMQDSLKSLGTGSRKSWLEAKAALQRSEGDRLNLQDTGTAAGHTYTKPNSSWLSLPIAPIVCWFGHRPMGSSKSSLRNRSEK